MARKIVKTARSLVAKATKSASSGMKAAADLNDDGKVDAKDARIATAWTRDKAGAVGRKVTRAAKAAVRTDLGKDVAGGAAIGALAAAPVPVIGPLAGAAIGAGVGVYKNVRSQRSSPKKAGRDAPAGDLHAEMLKLEDLRAKGLLTEAEFAEQKGRVLRKRK